MMDQLLTACKNGDLNTLKNYFETGSVLDVDAKDESGKNCLLYALEEGHLPVVKYLIEEQHANVAAEDERRNDPLELVCRLGHLPIVKYLLEKLYSTNVDTIQYDKKLQNGVLSACWGGQVSVMKYLIEERNFSLMSDGARNPITSAAIANQVPVVKYILEHVGSRDRELAERVAAQGLRFACMEHKFGVVDYILDKRNISAQERDTLLRQGLTIMNYTNLAMFQYLLEEKNAGRVVTRDMILSWMHRACSGGHMSMVKYLCEQRNFNVSGSIGMELLELACENGRLSVVKYLLQKGKLDTDSNSREMDTCFMRACAGNSLPLVKYLAEQTNFNIEAKDELGMTPLMIACCHGRLSTVQYLVEEKDANVDAEDNGGDTCLMHAYSNDCDSIVNYLSYDCLMDFPGISVTMDLDHSSEMEDFVGRFCSSASLLKQRRRQSIRNMRKFIQRSGLQEKWQSEHKSPFNQHLPLHIAHVYQFVETDNASGLSDLKVYIGEKDSSDEGTRTVVYARKEQLSKSCTFMENLLNGTMNDVKDDPDDPGMQTVELSQELTQDCPNDLLKQLIIFLSWSNDADRLEHYVTDIPSNRHLENLYCFTDIVQKLSYVRTVNALGIEMDFSEWIDEMKKAIRLYNRLASVEKDGHGLKPTGRDALKRFDSHEMVLWTQVLGECEDLYFFMLINAAPVTASSPTSIAPQCHLWLTRHGNTYKYRLSDRVTSAILNRDIGYDSLSGFLFMKVSEAEEFVKRKRQRTE